MLNLDFSLETIGERIDFLNNLLDSDQSFTHKELEKMGEYGRIVLGLLDFYLSPRI